MSQLRGESTLRQSVHGVPRPASCRLCPRADVAFELLRRFRRKPGSKRTPQTAGKGPLWRVRFARGDMDTEEGLLLCVIS